MRYRANSYYTKRKRHSRYRNAIEEYHSQVESSMWIFIHLTSMTPGDRIPFNTNTQSIESI